MKLVDLQVCSFGFHAADLDDMYAELSARHPVFDLLTRGSLKWMTATWPFVDRSGVIALPNFEVITPIPSYDPSFSKSFDDVALETAKELVDSGRRLEVFWSGGIDSTALILALREARPTRGQVSVTCNENSAAEYPDGLKMISNTFDVNLMYKASMPFLSINAVDDDRLRVTGEFGNFLIPAMGKMLFNVITAENNKRKVEGHWEDVYTPQKKFRVDNIPPKTSENQTIALKLVAGAWPDEEQLSLLREFVAAAPFKIETWYQYWFWWQFCTKWQAVWIRQSRGLSPADYSKYKDRHFAFYGTDEFQRWAIKNASLGTPMPDSWAMRKLPLKKFINRMFPDQDYFANKGEEFVNGVPWPGTAAPGQPTVPPAIYLAKRIDGVELGTVDEIKREFDNV